MTSSISMVHSTRVFFLPAGRLAVVLLAVGAVAACSSSSSSPAASGGANDAGGAAAGNFPTDAGSAPMAICTHPLSAADVSHPTTTVGTGTAASCTEAALSAAVKVGGVITFDCGGAATIDITSEIAVPTDRDTVIDGGGAVTLDGGSATRILDFTSGDYRGMYGGAQHVLTVQNITFANAKATGTKMFAAASPPCAQGYQDGAGGAILMTSGTLHVIGATFLDNQAADIGPDVGGGAIYTAGSSDTTIVGSRFVGNRASNGGAVGSLNSNLTLVNDTFTGNAAEGQGANSTNDTCPEVNGQRETGSGGNAGAVGIDGGDDGTVTVCGCTFSRNSAHALGGAIGRTPDGSQQTTTIDRSTFDSNTCFGSFDGADTGSAGAMYFHNSHLVITSSTISNNSAPGSGGLFTDSSTTDITNSTFVGNIATTGVGGAIASTGSLTNCTFANNQAHGTNYAAFAAALFGGPWVVANTIFDQNTDNDSSNNESCAYFGGTNSGHTNAQWPMGGTDTACVPGITFADPRVGSLADNGGPTATALPSAAASVIQVGANCPVTDQTGKMRATPCTIGAVEVP